MRITYVGGLEEVDPENDNIDVHVELDDGRVLSLLVMTPNNVFWCMENEGVDHYFGTPAVFVRLLNRDCIEKAIEALVTEDNGRWLGVYGTLQSSRSGE
jgi:hypothetical protein